MSSKVTVSLLNLMKVKEKTTTPFPGGEGFHRRHTESGS
jgi:hypothetical protein